MKECIFTLGIFDKKLVWTLIFPIIQILKDLLNNRLLKNRQHPELINLSGAIGQIFNNHIYTKTNFSRLSTTSK